MCIVNALYSSATYPLSEKEKMMMMMMVVNVVGVSN